MEASLLRLQTGPNPGKRLPLLPGILSVLQVVLGHLVLLLQALLILQALVLALMPVLELELELVPCLVLVVLSHLDPNLRSASTPRGRKPMVRLWMSLFHPRRVVNSPRSNGQRRRSRSRLSRSASPLDLHHPIIPQSLRIRSRISPNLRTTTPC